MTKNLPSKSAKEEALQEIQKEKIEEIKNRYKELLRKLEQAKKVVRNIEREIEEYDYELSGGTTSESSN